MDTNDVNESLLKLARLEQATSARIADLKQQLAALAKPLEDEIERLTATYAEADTALRHDLLDYMTETGDLHIHPAVTFQRRTKLIYDKNATLVAALQWDAMEYVRIKEELDVRAFEKAYRDGRADWAEVEEVIVPTLVIGKLGDLLIVHGDGG